MPIRSSHERAFDAAGLSLLYPGLGQAIQGRPWMAVWLVVDFTALAMFGLFQPAARGLWWGLALVLGVYAIVDAYRHDRPRPVGGRMA